MSGCSLLKRYYCQIYSLYNRFSLFDTRFGVQCVWADIYTGQTNIGDLDFELACVLYNIGTLHAELGTTNPRQTAEELKVSCTHFQCAAWAFQQLMEDKRLFRSNDLSNDVLLFFVQIMLAQAQECVLDKSLLDNRKPVIVAKVASQVVDYYKSAISMLQQGAMNTSSQSSIIEVIGSKLFKEWKKMVEFKLIYYNSIGALYMGNLCEAQQKLGERVSWFELADSKIKEAIKLAKQLDLHQLKINEALTFVTDVIVAKLSNAKKENDFIYHEKVVPVENLSMIKGASLVKGIPFSITDSEVSGPDIFARLVPMKAHQTASIYTAKKDEILRQVRRKIEEPNEELAAFMSSLQVEKESLRTPPEEPIPNELIAFCAELSLNTDSLDDLDSTLQQLETISKDTEKMIGETKELLKQEETKEKGHQEKYGKRPSCIILNELLKELSKHEETHQKASESNLTLWDNFGKIRDDIMIMMSSSASKIASILPSCKEVNFDDDVIAQMEKLLDKIDEMKCQRVMLEEKLVSEMNNENVIKLVLEHPNEKMDDIFDEEIKKFDKTISLIEQNIAAQRNILRAMTDCNARYAETRRNILDMQRNRKTRIASLLYAFEVFKELQTKSQKGLEFYGKFQTFVTRLNAKIRGVCKVQDEERGQFASAQEKRMLGPSAVSATLGPTSFGPAPAVTGPAKLKDFLPYMNRQPVAPPPLTQNYPPVPPPPTLPASNRPYPASNSPAVPVNQYPAYPPATPNYPQPSYPGGYPSGPSKEIRPALPPQPPKPVLPQPVAPIVPPTSYYGNTFRPNYPTGYQQPPPSVQHSTPHPVSTPQPNQSTNYAYTANNVTTTMASSYYYPTTTVASKPFAPTSTVNQYPASAASSAPSNTLAYPPSQPYHGSYGGTNVQYQQPNQPVAQATHPQPAYPNMPPQMNSQPPINQPIPGNPYSGGAGMQPNATPQPYYQNQAVTPAAAQYPQQQQQHYQQPNGSYVNNHTSVVQAIEIESKGGWPVLTPTVKAGVEDLTKTSSDVLPDILATMSISNQTATLSTKGSDSTLANSTVATTTAPSIAKPAEEEPKDLLSQFDPLFT